VVCCVQVCPANAHLLYYNSLSFKYWCGSLKTAVRRRNIQDCTDITYTCMYLYVQVVGLTNWTERIVSFCRRRFVVFMAVCLQIMVFRVLTSCNFYYWIPFRTNILPPSTWFMWLQPWSWWNHILPKLPYKLTSLHDKRAHKTTV